MGMLNTDKAIINTVAQYVRTVINVLLSLYSTRLVLNALGSADYGLYSVIAGVVAMLGFVSNALVISTQRYLSFYHGKNDNSQLYKVFGNSLLIHITISVFLLAILFSVSDWAVISKLDIPADRVLAARKVYIYVVLMLVLSFLTSPFRALFIARENIVYISLIDVLDGILKLVSALVLAYIAYDKLVFYALFLFCVMLFNMVAFGVFAFVRYKECHFPKIKEIDSGLIKDLLGFASWTLYSTGCVVMRTQGIAIIINKVYGVFLNASYGIAQQVSGALVNVSQAIANALSPQIIKAEGEGDHKRMLYLAGVESKYAFIMLSIVSIPIIFEMPYILNLWLGDVPSYSVVFCRMVIIAALFDTLTSGLGIANQATGNIKIYSLVFGTVKLLTLPLALLLLYFKNEPFIVMCSFVICEFFSSILRIIFLNRSAGLNIKSFIKESIFPALIIAFCSLFSCGVVAFLCNWHYRIIVMLPISLLASLTIFLITMTSDEKTVIRRLINRRK